MFSLKDSRFGVEKCKDSTARVVIFREFNIMNSFTLECSFFGKEGSVQTESNEFGRAMGNVYGSRLAARNNN